MASLSAGLFAASKRRRPPPRPGGLLFSLRSDWPL